MTRLLRFFAATSACAAAALLSSCGPSTDIPPGYASCLAPSAICISSSGTASCINITNDPKNCGACGTVCETPLSGGSAVCSKGECAPTCPGTMIVCGLAPVGTSSNLVGPDQVSGDGGTDAGAPSDAGTSDAGTSDAGTSDAGTSDAGTSDAGTDAGTTPPGSPQGVLICIDTMNDPNHCGSCDERCLDTQICQAGACVAAGQPGQGATVCSFGADGGPVYANLQSDPLNCGACASACSANEICVGGGCSPCDFIACNNVCVDPNVDVNNCGACGTTATTCVNGTNLAKPVITIAKALAGNLLPVGTPSFGVTVASGIRLAAVTVIAKAGGMTSNAQMLNLAGGDPNVSPTSWSLNWTNLSVGTSMTLMPVLAGGNSVELDFTATDEQYELGRSDAANHIATLTWTGTVGAVTPITLVLPTAMTTVAGAGAPLAANAWVPLNGFPIVLTETLAQAPAASSNIVGVEFHSVFTGSPAQDIALGGTSSVIAFTGVSASVTVNPTALGVGPRNIFAYMVDAFGNRYPGLASPPLALTVGDVVPYALGGVPTLTHSTDGIDSIWQPGTASAGSGPCPGISNFMAQQYDQPAPDAGMVGAKVGSTMFCTDTMVETYESTGVYGVKSDGTAIARFDGADAGEENDSFIVMPSTSTTKFRKIETQGVSGVALAADDSAANLWFGLAKDGVGDPAPELAGGSDGGPAYAVPPVDQPPAPPASALNVQQSTSGALWSWVAIPVTTPPSPQYQLDIFHPAITVGQTASPHVKSYATASGAIPQFLSVFSGGEFVWEVADMTSGNLSLGAGRFDGTNQPVDVTGATVGAFAVGDDFSIGGSVGTAANAAKHISAFFVPKPGILVGLTPSKTTTTSLPDGGTELATPLGYEVIEIDLTQTPAKVYQPLQITSATSGAGTVMLSGVQSRTGGFTTFTVSDDLTKVLFVTKDPALSPTRDTYSIRVLDLATGTQTMIYNSEFINNDDATNDNGRGGLTMYPHFLHGMNSYGTLPVSTPPIIIWAEELPVAGGSTAFTVYERLYYANYSTSTPAAVQIDHLAYESYNTATPSLNGQLVAESVTANAIYFLNDDGGGELSLFSRVFDGTASAALVAKGVVNWSLREDVGRQMVLRSDGSLLVGALSGNAALSAVYKSDSGSDPNLSLAPLGGFTPDGNHVWTLVHAGESNGGGGQILDGTLVTINLAGGAQTNWGESVNLLTQLSQPTWASLGASVGTLYGVDRVSGNENLVKLFTATSTAGTTHGPITNITAGITFGSAGASSAQYSLDLNEALFTPAGNQVLDLTSNPTTAQPFALGSSVAGGTGRAQPDMLIFGPSHLPTWEIVSANGMGLFKQFGGATFLPQIVISAGAGATLDVPMNRTTPDFSQYLAHFTDPSLGDYVMKLPGPGVAPFAVDPQ